jgi:hypothetical protein
MAAQEHALHMRKLPINYYPLTNALHSTAAYVAVQQPLFASWLGWTIPALGLEAVPAACAASAAVSVAMLASEFFKAEPLSPVPQIELALRATLKNVAFMCCFAPSLLFDKNRTSPALSPLDLIVSLPGVGRKPSPLTLLVLHYLSIDQIDFDALNGALSSNPLLQVNSLANPNWTKWQEVAQLRNQEINRYQSVREYFSWEKSFITFPDVDVLNTECVSARKRSAGL